MFYDCPDAWSLNIDLIFKEARIKIYLVASDPKHLVRNLKLIKNINNTALWKTALWKHNMSQSYEENELCLRSFSNSLLKK